MLHDASRCIFDNHKVNLTYIICNPVWGGRRLGRQTSGAAEEEEDPCNPHYEDVLVAVDNVEHQHIPVLTHSEPA